MSRFVRSSKYRHVFGKQEKKENCYGNVKITRSAWDSNYITANTQYFAVAWEAAGGGSVAVVNHSDTGKLPAGDVPVIAGHKGAVLDLKFHPHNESLLATASEDCYVKIWSIPDGGLKGHMQDSVQELRGHRRKVGTLEFHPTANNVLASTSTDFNVKVWDIEKGDEIVNVAGHSDIIQSSSWNYTGTLFATTSKDKKGRIFDPRSGEITTTFESHLGVKGARCCWLGQKEWLFTVGFTRSSEREYKIWDPKNMAAPIASKTIDTASGILMPFYDADTNMLYLAGKGDGNIRYFELTDEKPFIFSLSEFKSSTPQRGMTFLPKRYLNVSDCEIARALKLTSSAVEPISFVVPRKSDIFQEDIFPDTFSGEYDITADEWKGGKNGNIKTVSLEGGFVAKEKPQEFNPVVKEVAGPKTEKELREEYEKLKNRVSYLEAEIIKRDAKIKELGG